MLLYPGRRIISTLWIVVLLLGGCSSMDVKTLYQDLGQQPTEATHYDVIIPTHDGLELTATVFQPALVEGETAPVIIHAHGFGAFRADGPVSVYGQLILSGEAAVEAWRQGYWVVSYDSRGFGSSDGQVHLMDPEREVRDVSSVINWIDASLPRLHRNVDGKPYIGMLGESYGGGATILGSMMDARIDAIVPITTWYDLPSAFAHNGLVKSHWAFLLFSFGNINSFFDFDMMFEDAYLDMFGGYLNETVRQDMAIRSPSFYCDQGKTVQADALFIQGFSDALFDVSQGYDNWQCARRSQHDTRLLAILDGHKAIWPVQSWTGMPLYNTQPSITCDEQSFALQDAIVRWFDEKLKQHADVASDIPRLCAATTDDQGCVLEDLPQGVEDFWLPSSEVNLVQSGMFEVIMSPLDYLASAFRFDREPDPIEEQGMRGGFLRQAFVPLTVVEQADHLIGVPKINLHMTTTDSDRDGVLLIGVGVRHMDSFQVKVISEQYLPLTGDGVYHQVLPPISHQLQAGDTLGWCCRDSVDSIFGIQRVGLPQPVFKVKSGYPSLARCVNR